MKPAIRLLAVSLIALLPNASHAGEGAQQELRFVRKSDELPRPPPDARPRFQEALGAALARQIGRKVRYISLPRKRMVPALENGEGDILCGYVPAWMPGALEWSKPFIPVSDVLLSSPRVPAPARIEELRGVRIGTVLGFHYPEVEKKLGADFVRDDAPSSILSMLKWQSGRFDHVISPAPSVDKLAAKGLLPKGYHALVVNEIKTMCAIPPHGNLRIGELNAAIDAIEKSGELTSLLKLR